MVNEEQKLEIVQNLRSELEKKTKEELIEHIIGMTLLALAKAMESINESNARLNNAFSSIQMDRLLRDQIDEPTIQLPFPINPFF